MSKRRRRAHPEPLRGRALSFRRHGLRSHGGQSCFQQPRAPSGIGCWAGWCFCARPAAPGRSQPGSLTTLKPLGICALRTTGAAAAGAQLSEFCYSPSQRWRLLTSRPPSSVLHKKGSAALFCCQISSLAQILRPKHVYLLLCRVCTSRSLAPASLQHHPGKVLSRSCGVGRHGRQRQGPGQGQVPGPARTRPPAAERAGCRPGRRAGAGQARGPGRWRAPRSRRVPLARGLTRQAVLRWVVADDEAEGGAADAPARRSAGADLAELLEAAEHSAPAGARFRGHATADDDLLAHPGDGPDEQARARPAPQPAPLPSRVGSARGGG